MTRSNRIEFPGAFYHVFARGNNKQKIFHDTQDFTIYLDRIERYHKRYKFILYAYALMSNHIHFAIETCEIPLSKIMQGIQESFAHYIHKKYGSVGHLFQGPYRAILYEKEEFALNLVRYIHLNPVEARLVEYPEHYPWCSHRVYLNMEVCSFLDTKTVLNWFAKDEDTAIHRYNEFMSDELKSSRQQNFDRVKDRQFCGNKEFVESIKKIVEDNSHDSKLDLNENFAATPQKTLIEILKIVSKQTKVSADSILSQSRIRTITETRRIFAFISAKYGGYETVGISRILKKDASSVSCMIHKLERELVYDPILSEKIRKIIHIINV